MKGGDISNVAAPIVMVVFDDLIGAARPGPAADYRPPGSTVLERVITRLRGAPAPARHWEVDPVVAATLQRLWNFGGVGIEVVEFCDELEAITGLLDAAGVPYQDLTHTQPDRLARDLAWRPDVTAVYHPYPEHGFKYGSRGRLVTPDLRNKIGYF